MTQPRAQVVLICGPSGSGKTRLAARSGLPVLGLDDFFLEGIAPDLPRGADGLVDWNSPLSWRADAALDAVERLCVEGTAEIPVYEMGPDRVVGSRVLDLGGMPVFVADGVFAGELIDGARSRGLLADAVVLRRSPLATMLRRTRRDLRERRKTAPVVLRRTVALWRRDRALVAGFVQQGARPVTMREAEALLARLRRAPVG